MSFNSHAYSYLPKEVQEAFDQAPHAVSLTQSCVAWGYLHEVLGVGLQVMSQILEPEDFDKRYEVVKVLTELVNAAHLDTMPSLESQYGQQMADAENSYEREVAEAMVQMKNIQQPSPEVVQQQRETIDRLLGDIDFGALGDK